MEKYVGNQSWGQWPMQPAKFITPKNALRIDLGMQDITHMFIWDNGQIICGTMPFVQFACGLPCYCHRLWGNVAKAFNTTLQWDWFCCGCHLIHNVVNAGLESLKNHAANPAQATVAMVQKALDRSVLLSFHCIVAQMMCLLCHMNTCVMSCIPKWILNAFFGVVKFASCMGHCPQLWFPTYLSIFLYPIF